MEVKFPSSREESGSDQLMNGSQALGLRRVFLGSLITVEAFVSSRLNVLNLVGGRGTTPIGTQEASENFQPT
jgi:hypothetical protein